MSNGWKSISTLPDDSDDILLFWSADYGVFTGIYNEDEGDWSFASLNGDDLEETVDPSHWQPLPDGPADVEG